MSLQVNASTDELSAKDEPGAQFRNMYICCRRMLFSTEFCNPQIPSSAL